tara:strand:- start:446 stop:667 length:222 start_codon:yes stop_codon:yes gene_type:complete
MVDPVRTVAENRRQLTPLYMGDLIKLSLQIAENPYIAKMRRLGGLQIRSQHCYAASQQTKTKTIRNSKQERRP